MPFEPCCRWHVDEDILPCLSKEPFPSHLDLNGLGWVLNNFDDHHSAEAAQESHNALNRVDDETPQDEGPGLEGRGREVMNEVREGRRRGGVLERRAGREAGKERGEGVTGGWPLLFD